MKKLFLSLIAMLSILSSLRADEGMWLLPQMERVHYAKMRELGLQLTAEQIYSANQPSIKDAIVIFGGGCTGEIVSPNGLLFTNHHCGFGSIQMLSSVGADYLKDGFWAQNEQGELPVPGLSVQFVRRIVDVTPEILGNIPSTAGQAEREKMVGENIKTLEGEFNSNKLFIPRVTVLLEGESEDGVAALKAKLSLIVGVEAVMTSSEDGFTEVVAHLSPALTAKNAAKVHASIASAVKASEVAPRTVEVSPLLNNFKGAGNMVSIKPFFGGNQYFMFVMERYTDVRLVGAPPQSIGKFGGETDNWMWPRHTGDFAIFRVYAGKNNRPADYSAKNKPYKSEEYLKISTAGYEEGDFSMILGFPGSTQRYMTSYEIDMMLDVFNPQRITIREERQNILKEKMAASDKVRIQYASKYATSSNYWKNSIGMSRGIKKLNVKGLKESQQIAFQEWAERNTLPQEGYIDALALMDEGVNGVAAERASQQYISEAVMRAMDIYSISYSLRRELADNPTSKQRKEYSELVERIYKDYDYETEVEVAAKMLSMMAENMEIKPAVFAEVIDAKYNGDTKVYVDYIYSNSPFATEQGAQEFVASYTSKEELNADPIMQFVNSVREKMIEVTTAIAPYDVKMREAHRKYVAGLQLMNPEGKFYPDANFTIRLTYGQVLPYSPADGVFYNYQTTLAGVIAKEDTSNPTEFTVEDKLKEIYYSEDYGNYADKNGSMPVAFLSSNDITGGNSGSPVLNAKGELIGLAFDGNWEAMSGDVAFENSVQRTISVDVRYLLLILDKYAGAGWLLDEMTINN